MIHRETYEVRWHDTDAKREVSPGGILTLMQETGNFQFDRIGRNMDAMRDAEGVGFILSRISLDFLAPVYSHEKIDVETFTVEGRGVIFKRGFRAFRDGTLVARGSSQWALVRLSDRSLISSKDYTLPFTNEAEEETQTPLRFRLGRELVFEEVGKRTVTYTDIDYNLHMNNTKYPNMLCDFLTDPLGVRVVGMSLFYCHEAAFGDTLTVERAAGEDGVCYFRAKKGDTVCLEALVRTVPIN